VEKQKPKSMYVNHENMKNNEKINEAGPKKLGKKIISYQNKKRIYKKYKTADQEQPGR
jgi:hypothetical protein